MRSLLDPSVKIEEDTAARKTFSPGEETVGFISGVSVHLASFTTMCMWVVDVLQLELIRSHCASTMWYMSMVLSL